VIAVEAAAVVVVAAVVADSAEEEVVVVEAAAVAAADSEEEMEAVPVATHPDPEPTTDWSWKICLLVHLGRI